MEQRARVIPMQCNRRTCEACTLIGQCLARNCDSPDADDSFDIAVAPKVYHRNEHLFRCGEDFKSIFVIRSGAVKTHIIGSNGEEQVIGFHFSGDLLGIDAVESARHVSHAQVLDTSSICKLPYPKLSRLCMRSRTVQQRLIAGISRKMREDESLLLMLGQKSAEQRIATFLLDISHHQERQGFSACEFNLPMSRADIGSYLALAVETVSRVLTRLQGTYVLSVERNHIRILDLVALAELAEEHFSHHVGPQKAYA